MDVCWPVMINGDGGVLTRVNLVDQPWKMKNGTGRSSGGERHGI
jgi:hypothetical protein